MTDTPSFANAVKTEATAKSVTVPQDFFDKCKRGHYHDFKSSLATPKLQLINDLEAMGLSETAARVLQGHFDE